MSKRPDYGGATPEDVALAHKRFVPTVKQYQEDLEVLRG